MSLGNPSYFTDYNFGEVTVTDYIWKVIYPTLNILCLRSHILYCGTGSLYLYIAVDFKCTELNTCFIQICLTMNMSIKTFVSNACSYTVEIDK